VRPIPWQADHQHGVFTTEQAVAAGWSMSTLNRHARTGRLVRLRRGTFGRPLDVGSPSELRRAHLGQRGVAAALRIPRATVSHAAAVAVHGLPLLHCPPTPCVTLPPPLRTREAALHVHRQPIPTWQLDPGCDFSITSVARSCIDFTREAGLNAGVVAADAALHRTLCTLADLESVYETCKGRAGLSSGRQLLDLVDGRSESPLESISRLAMRPSKPAPRTQVNLHTRDGRFLARVDFYWDGLGVVGEADGQAKYTDQELWREKLRQDRLTDHGLVVVRWGSAEASNPAILQAKLDKAFRRAAVLRSAGIPVAALTR
jgi:hypothetical protein